MIKKAGILVGYIFITVVITFFPMTAVQAGCEKGDCSNGPGIYAWPDGAKYDGTFLNGKFHGRGTYTWSDGKKYVGEFKNDKRNGLGTYTWPNGASYTGEWEKGQKAGYGIYTFPNGSQNIGLWKNGKLSQKMEKSEIETFISPAPQQAPIAAAAAPAMTPDTDADLEKQLAALGGETAEEAVPTGGEESLAVTEAAPARTAPAATPFLISTQKLLLIDGRDFKTWEKRPLLAVGPIQPVGSCSVKISETRSDKSSGKLVVKLKVVNSSGCALDFKGFLQAGEFYTKVVSWSGEQAIAPGDSKETLETVTLDKNAPRSKVLFKLQGAGCRM